MLRFTAADLRQVALEARERQCSAVLIKYHGVYVMAEHGESDPSGHRCHVAVRVALAFGLRAAVALVVTLADQLE